MPASREDITHVGSYLFIDILSVGRCDGVPPSFAMRVGTVLRSGTT